MTTKIAFYNVHDDPFFSNFLGPIIHISGFDPNKRPLVHYMGCYKEPVLSIGRLKSTSPTYRLITKKDLDLEKFRGVKIKISVFWMKTV